MTSALRLLFALSLGANLVAGTTLLVRRAASTPPAGDAAEKSAAADGIESAAAPVPPRRSAALNPAEPDLLLLKESLIAEGFPKQVVEMILATLVDQRHGVYELEAQLRTQGDNPALRQQLQERLKQGEAEMRRLTDLYEKLDAQKVRTYAARYGDLPPATIEAIRKLESEHSRPVSATDRQFATALQGLLSAPQIAEYLRYNSLTAKMIQQTLSSIDVDEAVYSTLLDAALARDGAAAYDLQGREAGERNSQPATVENYRRVLGDEAFLQIAARFDPVIATADGVYQVAGLTPQARADLFLEIYRVKHQYATAARAGGSRAEMQEAARRAYATIVQKAALTPEQIAGFDEQLGAMLKRGEFGNVTLAGVGAGRAW